MPVKHPAPAWVIPYKPPEQTAQPEQPKRKRRRRNKKNQKPAGFVQYRVRADYQD